MKHLLMLVSATVAAALAGCLPSHAEVDPVDPAVALSEVRVAVESVAVADGPEAASAAWRLAHERFELALEPHLREGCGERPTVEIEYAFGQVAARLASGATSEPVAALLAALDEAANCLPEPDERAVD